MTTDLKLINQIVMKYFKKSSKLDNVCYDIRGPVLDHANRMEDEGLRIMKLNLGNPAPFGFDAPEEIIHDVIQRLADAQGYCHSKGIYSARKAIMQRCQIQGIDNVEIEDVILGNGVSELITLSMQALLEKEEEILVPAPDYPLWTASIALSGGEPVHYLCDEENDWQPDVADIASKITARTRGIVIINPNNPTGAVYSREILEQIIELARKHDLILFADEIYDRILYDDAEHIPLASLANDVLCITFNGLSKTYRLAGFRSGWMIISGAKQYARSYIQGIEMLASMRLCANVPAMYAIQTALGGYQSINDLTCEGGRLREQRDAAWEAINAIEGVSCVKPKGALYLFPKIDLSVYNIEDDEQLILDLLLKEQILLVQGTAFNWPEKDHFRIVFLPRKEDLSEAIGRFGHFLQAYKK